MQWNAPFPPPDAIERYEKVQAGTWDRLLKMAEQAQAAQIEAEKRAQTLARGTSWGGLFLGCATTLVAMWLAYRCVVLDHPAIAAVFLSVPVMSVAKALIEARKRREKKD